MLTRSAFLNTALLCLLGIGFLPHAVAKDLQFASVTHRVSVAGTWEDLRGFGLTLATELNGGDNALFYITGVLARE